MDDIRRTYYNTQQPLATPTYAANYTYAYNANPVSGTSQGDSVGGFSTSRHTQAQTQPHITQQMEYTLGYNGQYAASEYVTPYMRTSTHTHTHSQNDNEYWNKWATLVSEWKKTRDSNTHELETLRELQFKAKEAPIKSLVEYAGTRFHWAEVKSQNQYLHSITKKFEENMLFQVWQMRELNDVHWGRLNLPLGLELEIRKLLDTLESRPMYGKRHYGSIRVSTLE